MKTPNSHRVASRPHRSVLLLLAASAIAFASCVAPTNPYDDETPPELQAPGRIIGTVAMPTLQGEAPRAPNGIHVWAQLVGSAEAAAEVTTVDGDGGRFALELNPGNYFLSADHPAFGQATAGPVRLAASGEIDVGVLELRAAEPSAALSGSVVTQGGLSPSGIEVSLVHLLDDTNCGAVEAKTNTAADGSYRFDAVRPGEYAVVAKTEGATVDVLLGAEKVTLAAEEDKDLALENKELLLQPAANVIIVSADGASPTETSRTRELGLSVLGFDGVTQMQLGGDATFDPGLGATGWQPFAASLPFTLPDAEGEWGVYAQLRSSCVTSPLYTARVFYDASPPEIISAQAGTVIWDPFSPAPPLVVVGSGLAGVSITLNVIDATGVDEVRFIVNGDATATQVEDIDGQPGQALVRATAFIPVEERRYRLRIELTDLAGNVTPLDASPLFDVLRDISPPTTPVPVAGRYTATGDRALVWLAERPCPDGSTAWVCEANVHNDGAFLVRGGPALVDFTPFTTPPFDVPLFADGTTVIEIIARDAGGQQSPGTARVEIARRAPKTLFTAPIDKELGAPLHAVPDWNNNSFSAPARPGQEPAAKLYAQGGHAFFSLRHRPGASADSYFSWLIAQPASSQDVGLVPSSGPHPEGVRKLSVTDDIDWSETYYRTAAALGAGAGAFTWLEHSPGYNWFMPQWPRRRLVYADGDGTFDVSTLSSSYFADVDIDGDPAPYAGDDEDDCESQGVSRCAYDAHAWTPRWTQPPAESAFDGRSFVTSGAATRALPFIGSDEGTVEVTGPAVVLVSIPDPDLYAIRPVVGLFAPIQARAGSLLMSAFYRSSGGTWRGEPDDDVDEFVANVMTGSGREFIQAPEGYYLNYNDRALGIYVPAGESITVPLVSLPAGDVVGPDGLIAREFADASEAGELNKIDAASLDRTDVVPRFTLLLGDRDPIRIGEHNGLTVASWGADGEPFVTHDPTAAELAAVDDRVQRAEQSAGVLAQQRSAITPVPTAASDGLYTPSEGCTLMVRADEDLALRGFSIPGAGLMDDLRVGIWELEGVSPLGVYERTVLNPAATPDQAFLYPTQPDDVSSCDDHNEVQATFQETHDLVIETTELTTQTVNATATVYGSENWADSATLAEGEWVVAGMLPVSPGQRVLATIYSPGATGDMDAYLKWNGPPANLSDRDESSGAYGNDESFDEIAPGDATSVYIFVYAYNGYGDVAGWNVDITVTAIAPPLEVGVYTLFENDTLEVETVGANGDVDIYLTTNGPWNGSPYSYTRRSRTAGTANELVSLNVDEDYYTEVWVTVDQPVLPADYTVTVRLLRPTLVQVGSYALTAGQALRVDTSGTERSIPYIRFGAEPTAELFECRDDVDGYGTTADCTVYAPAGATVAYVAVAADGTATDVTVDVEIADAGCSEVRIVSFQGNGLMRAGRTYAISISDYLYDNQGPLTWDVGNASIYRGTSAATDYLRVLGVAAGASVSDGKLIVPSIDAAGPRCRVDFDVITRSLYRSLSASSGDVVAVREDTEADGSRSATVVVGQVADASLVDNAPLTTVETLPLGWDVLSTQVVEGRAYWLQTDPDGSRAAVRSALIGPAQPASCEVASLPGDFAAHRAAWGGNRLAVTGRQGGADVVLLYDLDTDNGCDGLTLTTRRALPGRALAVAVDQGDLFTWAEPEGTGGRLSHHDVRDLVPVHPGGTTRVLGADGEGGDTYVSLYGANDPTAGRLEHLVFAPDGSLTSSSTLATGGPYIQPRALTAGVAYVAPQAPVNDADPAVWLLANAPGATPVSLDVGTALDDAPDYHAAEPYGWNATPMLESDGDVLALLGFDAAGARRLRIYDVPADPAGWAGLVANHDVSLDNMSEVVSLSVSGGAVVVTFADIDEPARAFHADSAAAGLWVESWVGARDTERVIGAVAGELLVIEFPGDLFALQPPAFAAVTTRVPGTAPVTPAGVAAPMRAPSALYLHSFSATGMSPAGDVLLYDESGLAPVLWSLDAASGRAAPADGARRPLNEGAESLGIASLPRVAGDALLFLRAEDAGIALLRQRL